MCLLAILPSLSLSGSAQDTSSPPSGTSVNVTVDIAHPGVEIPSEALGLSYETSRLQPNAQGVHYFRPDNGPLLELFSTLGVKSLRVGGNSVDDPKVPLPALEDVRALFEFARRAKVKVIYAVRLEDGDPASAATYARLIQREFREQLDSFAIGNEPYYYKDYDVYRTKWAAIRDAILREYPDATFCGSDQNPDPELIKKVVRDFGTAEGHLVQITQHFYSFGCSYRNPLVALTDANQVESLVPFDAAEARMRMIAPPYSSYEKVLKGMQAAVAGTPLTFRLTETNSFWFSGLKGASDRYASALWAVDYLHWWLSRGAAGMNFHTGDRTGGSVNLPCRYAAFVSAPTGYEVRPLAYGMKLFSLHGTGRYLPVQVTGEGSERISAYATRQADGKLILTLLNRDPAGEKSFRVEIGSTVGSVRTLDLRAAANDLAADSTGVTLGDSAIDAEGKWHGQWKSLESPIEGSAFRVNLPPASASTLEISLR